jgi:hypothetical protein
MNESSLGQKQGHQHASIVSKQMDWRKERRKRQKLMINEVTSKVFAMKILVKNGIEESKVAVLSSSTKKMICNKHRRKTTQTTKGGH